MPPLRHDIVCPYSTPLNQTAVDATLAGTVKLSMSSTVINWITKYRESNNPFKVDVAAAAQVDE